MNAATLAGAALAFCCEIAVYVSAGYWGWTRATRLPTRLALATGAVLVPAGVWGLFGAPTATHPLHGTARVILDIGWFGAGILALLAARARRTALRTGARVGSGPGGVRHRPDLRCFQVAGAWRTPADGDE